MPDPNAIGETEQALLDAQKKGRSSTIATSAKGLLSGDDEHPQTKRSSYGWINIMMMKKKNIAGEMGAKGIPACQAPPNC